MDCYVTGSTVRQLRQKKNLTQGQLAEMLSVSDKTISKWETGKGLPDISLLQPLAAALDVTLSELLSGQTVQNTNRHAKMYNVNFYVCPVCGNVICAIGEGVYNCHGIQLPVCTAEPDDKLEVRVVEDELFVSVAHPMSKEHYISFVCGVSADGVQLVKLYPEGNAEARLKRSGTKYIYYYDNRDGLFVKRITV